MKANMNAPWHKESYDRFLDETLPALLSERLPLVGYEVERPKDSIVVYSGRFADYSYGEEHPFSPGRARATLRLMDQEGYLSEPWTRVEEPELVAKVRLHESHDPEYITALEGPIAPGPNHVQQPRRRADQTVPNPPRLDFVRWRCDQLHFHGRQELHRG